MQKKAAFKTKGMQRDLAASAFTSEFAYENKNIRITATDDNTLLSIVNERGNKEITFCKYIYGSVYIKDPNLRIKGTPIGRASINEYLVLFTHDSVLGDYIYSIKIIEDDFILQELYNGNLSFSTLHPIETLASYENNEVIKVYWVDGKNQPRVINIVAPEEVRNNWSDSSFDFIQELKLNEIINVTRTNTSGSFAAGVIQYAFSYYNKNAQETNIFYTTPINYISYDDRGGSPEDTVVNSFNISVNNVDKNFDYLRIYSIHRTSIDATPTVKLVADVKVPEPSESSIRVSFLDTGNIGSIIDPVELLYKGGEYIIPKTLAQKDGTLFLGNIKVKSDNIDGLEGLLESWRDSSNFLWSNRVITNEQELQGYYPYSNPLGQQDITGFKARETYRLGIQFQHISGKWAEPIMFDDKIVDVNPKCEENYSTKTTSYFTTKGSLKITQDIKDWAAERDYIRVRPVVVLPSEQEREVLTQGILCPTVSNLNSRSRNTIDVQPSWFLRPNTLYTYTGDESPYPIYGEISEFRHNHTLPECWKRNAEIQCNCVKYSQLYNVESIAELYPDLYLIDKSIITLHSPEIEFNNITKVNDTKLRIVGYTSFTSNAGDLDIVLSNAPEYDYLGNVYNGIHPTEYYNGQLSQGSLVSGLFFYDRIADFITQEGKAYYTTTSGTGEYNYKVQIESPVIPFMVYPWHRAGALNNSKNTSSVIKTKKISNLKYAAHTSYLDTTFNFGESYSNKTIPGVSDIKIANGESVVLDTPNNIIRGSGKYKERFTYSPNVSTIVYPSESIWIYEDGTTYSEEGYPINIGISEDGYNKDFSDLFTLPIGIMKGNTKIIKDAIIRKVKSELKLTTTSIDITEYKTELSNTLFSKDPIKMSYKSTPHAVVVLDYTEEGNQYILPRLGNYSNDESKVYDSSVNTIDNFTVSQIVQDSISLPRNTYTFENNYLWIAELYREVPNKFGGSEYSSNLWLPAGKPVRIVGATKNEQGKYTANTLSTVVQFTQGDTFFARFDSLKTYPYTLEDINSIVEIGSFMVETRINLDARYDRNRGKKSNLVMTPTNFNLFNEVYNQRDTFFNYRIKDEKYGDTTNFPNLITYTKTKTSGELIDTWTNITLASTLDLDGDKGELRALRRLNNNILAFQDTGISQILYNENVQIASTEGVPIEIANSGKVTGKRYISDKIGCTNKWSICETPSGLYFIDDITKGIYLFNGQLTNISDSLGFSSWINKNSKLSIWNPEYFSNFITYYDKVNGEVLFVNKDECLAFSEVLKQFTSFYSYEGMYFFTNLKGKGIAFKDNNNEYSAWLHNEGDYNKFFGWYKPFYTTLIVNPNMTSDKIFNNIEFRSDTWEWDTVKKEWELSNITFDTLEVWDEYQRGKSILVDENNKPSNLKRKFRIWRANIPRDESNGRDRMRNPWLYLKLSMNNENTNKTILHDITVDYFE